MLKESPPVEQDYIRSTLFGYESNLSGIKNMLYTRYKSNQLRIEYEQKNVVTYDWVVMARPDILFKSPFDISFVVKQYEMLDGDPDNCRFCYYRPWSTPRRTKKFSVCWGTDLLYFGKPNIITKSLDIYNKIKNSNKKDIEAIYINSEALQARNDYENNIELALFPYDREIIRLHQKKLINKIRNFLRRKISF